jgi:cell wall-associated NlpC family hydrolase
VLHRHAAALRASLRAAVPAGALVIGILASTGVAYAEPTKAQLEQQISAKSTELEKVVEQYNRINEQLTQTRADITSLEAILTPLQQQADKAHANVAEIANTAYRSGSLNGWGALLAGGSRDSVISRLDTLHQLTQRQQGDIDTAHDATAKHQQARTALQTQVAEADARSQALDAQKKGIESELSKLNDLKRRLYGTVPSGGSAYTGPIPQVAGNAGLAVTFAYNAIGKPYVWAASGPNGYDCSGLTLAAWRTAGVSLPHNAAMQWDKVAHISKAELAPGDLVFYSGLGHVGIYVGNNQVIHAPSFGDSVKLSSVTMMPPYGYGRVRA